MANSKYEYVKSFEVDDKIRLPNLIVVRIDGRNFCKFAQDHQFTRPNDRMGLKLMNSCATAVMQKYRDIVFSYGFSDEYSFVFKKNHRFYHGRTSKILSIITSFFTSLYTASWKEFFPQQELRYAPSFHAQVVACPTVEVLQAFLAWRQNDCHLNNLYDTCFWELVKSGKDEMEARRILQGTQKQEKNELLFQHFCINYKKLEDIFRQGTCLFWTEIEDIVKYKDNGDPVARLRKKIAEFRSENIASQSFWNKHSCLLKELGRFEEDIRNIEQQYLESFQLEEKLMQSTWIVVRIDGCDFHRFCEEHGFEKPNDERALNLMNLCAVAVLQEFHDIIFSYGVSDEYSFILKRETQFCRRDARKIVSVIVSTFSAMYVMKWGDCFPEKELIRPPCFDARAVCYPSSKILRDYLAWRQVDCHINNQYNTCFWMLVKSGKTKSAAQERLQLNRGIHGLRLDPVLKVTTRSVDLVREQGQFQRTQARDKNELLKNEFGMDYNELPLMFRRGSSVFRKHENKRPWASCSTEDAQSNIVVEHCNIIDETFWQGLPCILDEN